MTNLHAQRIEAPDNKFYATVSTFSSYMNGGGTYSYDALQIYDVTANDSVHLTQQGLNFAGTYDIYCDTTWASPFLGVDLNFYQNNSYPGTAGYNGFQFNAYGGQGGSANVYSTTLTVDGVGGMTATTSVHGTTQSCKEHFGKIEERLDKGDTEFKEQGEKLVELKTDLTYLAKSLDGVTKALWRVAFSIAITLLGFFIWYVENVKK